MLGEVVNLVDKNEVSNQLAKNIIYEAMEKNIEPLEIIKSKNIKQISDEGELINIIKKIISESPDQVKEYLSGKEMVANFLVGKVMKETNKQANPATSLKLIKEELERMK